MTRPQPRHPATGPPRTSGPSHLTPRCGTLHVARPSAAEPRGAHAKHPARKRRRSQGTPPHPRSAAPAAKTEGRCVLPPAPALPARLPENRVKSPDRPFAHPLQPNLRRPAEPAWRSWNATGTPAPGASLGTPSLKRGSGARTGGPAARLLPVTGLRPIRPPKGCHPTEESPEKDPEPRHERANPNGSSPICKNHSHVLPFVLAGRSRPVRNRSQLPIPSPISPGVPAVAPGRYRPKKPSGNSQLPGAVPPRLGQKPARVK